MSPSSSPSPAPTPSPYLLRADAIAAQAETLSHPWNPHSHLVGTPLSRLVGLQRIGVSFAKIPPGKESFIYHSHQREEEWLYIISGHGIAEIDGQDFEVGAGDFMGFPTPSVAHHLRNPDTSDAAEDLVYIMGGENREIDVADFPHLQRRMVRLGDEVEIYDRSTARGFDGWD